MRQTVQLSAGTDSRALRMNRPHATRPFESDTVVGTRVNLPPPGGRRARTSQPSMAGLPVPNAR
ncbi:class I SAM-dependent methyltransferase [Streptomyces sp. NPDC015684]|uniref:class I SAM-dependent methyltransferase n=1 Tax=Streptomyces sp. NPDC015684 TaxID=3364963 RepID=UPI003702CCF0